MIVDLLICLVFGILIHETAHLIAAKSVGCHVEVFSIGFGKPIFKKKIGETIYQFTPILLGGYNQLKDELQVSKSKRAFTNLTYTKKLIVVLAGVVANVLTGAICLFLGTKLLNYHLLNFGYLSIILGLSNALPIPALDGSYPLLVWLEKPYGKKKGYALMEKITKIGFRVLMFLNLVFIGMIIAYAFLTLM